MRLIDADKLRQYFFRPYSNEESYSNIDLERIIGLQPTIDSKQRNGMWLLVDGYRCSCCNYKLETTGIPQSCPNCDAEMQQGGDAQ